MLTPSSCAERESASFRRRRDRNAVVLPGQLPDGQYILSVLLKRTYDIVAGKPCRRAKEDRELHSGDVHFGDPMNTTVCFEADFVPYKLATDVVLHGFAYAPHEKPTETLEASLKIGEHQRRLRIVGDRVCHYNQGGLPIFEEPVPFARMELRYERAYGGVDIYSDPSLACGYPRNHLGCGFVISNQERSIEGLALPNVESPDDRLTPERLCTGHFMHWERQPMPQGFGWFCKFWKPRAGFAGVMPADRVFEKEMRRAFSELVPSTQRELYEQTQLPDMDFRFFNGASQGLTVPFLAGTETVELENLTPHGTLHFSLPGDKPRLGLDLGKGIEEPEPALHTVMIHAEEQQINLVWRGAVTYAGPDCLPNLEKLDILVQE